MEQKLIALLEFYLCLHEADEIHNMLHDDSVEVKELVEKLVEFREDKELYEYLLGESQDD